MRVDLAGQRGEGRDGGGSHLLAVGALSVALGLELFEARPFGFGGVVVGRCVGV